MKNQPQPTSLTVHQSSRTVEIAFDDGKAFQLPFEFLRVHSPSAEVQGHGPGQETLQTGKRNVVITALEAVGHYAVQPTFDDGHSSGIFSWGYFYDLGMRQDELWANYEQRLHDAGANRDTASPVASTGGAAGGCASHKH